MDILIRYPWPGNVRELMNSVERAVVLCQGDYLDDKDFRSIRPETPPGLEPDASALHLGQEMTLEDVEKSVILNTLENTQGNKSETARRLGITRKTLHKKLKLYGKM